MLDFLCQLGVSAAAVCLRWHLQRGVPVFPKTVLDNELKANNKDHFGFSLSHVHMQRISALEMRHHYLRPGEWYGLPLWH